MSIFFFSNKTGVKKETVYDTRYPHNSARDIEKKSPDSKTIGAGSNFFILLLRIAAAAHKMPKDKGPRERGAPPPEPRSSASASGTKLGDTGVDKRETKPLSAWNSAPTGARNQTRATERPTSAQHASSRGARTGPLAKSAGSGDNTFPQRILQRPKTASGSTSTPARKVQPSPQPPTSTAGAAHSVRPKPDRVVPKVPVQEVAMLFASDSQFPALDHHASSLAPKGSWARGAGAGGRWTNPPLDAETTHTPAPLMALPQHKSGGRRADEEKWVTVKPKAGGRAEAGAAPAHVPSAWGGWGGVKTREPESHAPASAAKAGRGPPPSIGPTTFAPVQSEAKRTGRKAPILLSELIPVLRRKDVKMPTPYTARQLAEADRNKVHKRTDNLVRNPNAADGQAMVVLRRKEKEGGKKKAKISPLKKLILRDRRDRLDRQTTVAAEPTQSAADDTVSSNLQHQSTGDSNDTEANSALLPAGIGQLGEEASKLALEWLSQRGMDPANPEHVQELLNSLNEEDEDDDDDDVDSEAQETAGKCSWLQLPSTVTWSQNVRTRPAQACSQSAGHSLSTPLGIEKPCLGPESSAEQIARPARDCVVESCVDIDEPAVRDSHTFQSQAHSGHGSAGVLHGASDSGAKECSIPQWAQVNAPEFRPGEAAASSNSFDGAGAHSSPAAAPAAQRAASTSNRDTEVSLDVSAAWAAQPLQEPKSPKKKGKGKVGGGGEEASKTTGKEHSKRPDGAQAKGVKITTGSVNHGDGKSAFFF